MTNEYYACVYLAMKGWAAVVYGPEGPEETGPGRATPEEAQEDARRLAEQYECKLGDQVFGDCPKHGHYVVNGKCEICRVDDLRAKIMERKANYAAQR